MGYEAKISARPLVVPDATAPGQALNRSTADRAYAQQAKQLVNVRDYGALGDGLDDTAAIDAAFAVRGAVYFPAGTYGYSGNGYAGDGPIVKGDGRRVTQIALGAGKSLLTRASLYAQLHVEGIRFVGGFGAIRHTFGGINVQGEHTVTRCEFSNYTGAAISTLSTDMPYWKITNNVFFGLNFTSTIGIAIGGNTDLCEISGNEFLKNRIHVKVTSGGNNAKITRNDFIRFGSQEGGIPRADIWVVPSISNNAGTGFEVSNNKFGNENVQTGDLLVVYADEDTSAGTNRADRFPDLTTIGTRAVRGHQLVGNAYYGGSSGARPIIFSTTPFVSDSTIAGFVAGTPPTYLIQYLSSPGSQRTLDNNIYGPILGGGGGVEVPAIPVTNGAAGTYQLIDPHAVFTGNGIEPAAWPGGGDLAGYVPLLAAPMSSYTASNCTPAGTADALGRADAVSVTLASNSALSRPIAAPTAGATTWVEVDLRQGTSPAAHLRVNLFSAGGVIHWQRVITPTAEWRRYRFCWTPRDVSAGISVSLGPRVAEDAGGILIGRVRIYHAAEPVNVDGSMANLLVQGNASVAGATGTVGFYGSAGTTKPTVTGVKGGNAALASLIAALVAQGLIADGTT